MERKVRFSAFPGNKLIASPETFGWAVVSTYSEEVKEGAVEFLKFRTKFNLEEKKELMDKNGRTEISQLLQDYVNAYNNNPQIVPNYQVKWNSILQEETIGECLPQLAAGKNDALRRWWRLPMKVSGSMRKRDDGRRRLLVSFYQ